MSDEVVVRHIPVKNRLATLIKMPGGKKLKDALSDAERNLETVKADCISQIDALVGEIQTLASGAGDPDLAARERLYDLGNQIVSLAGTFGMSGLGRAAYSLCELIDVTLDTGGCPRGEIGCTPKACSCCAMPSGSARRAKPPCWKAWPRSSATPRAAQPAPGPPPRPRPRRGQDGPAPADRWRGSFPPAPRPAGLLGGQHPDFPAFPAGFSAWLRPPGRT